jgi:hypothetical protein
MDTLSFSDKDKFHMKEVAEQWIQQFNPGVTDITEVFSKMAEFYVSSKY